MGEWEVTLTTGQVLTIAAHAFTEADDAYVFSMLMRGKPGRVPAAIVATVHGG